MKIILGLFFIALSSMIGCAQTSPNSPTDSKEYDDVVDLKKSSAAAKECELPDADKTSIIEFMLKNDGQFGVGISSASLDSPATIYVLNKNIEPKLLPKLANVSYVLLEPDKISLDDNKESLNYWEFRPLECADLKVTATYGVTTLTHKLMPVAYGFSYELEKVDSKWIGKWIGNFVTE